MFNPQKTRLWAGLLALSFLLAGGGLIVASAFAPDGSIRQVLARVAGSTLIASVAIGIAVNWILKPTFVLELVEHLGTTGQLKACGISAASVSFQGADVPWSRLFETSQNLTLLTNYAKYWRQAHEGDLRVLLGKRAAHLTVILPDFRDAGLMGVLENQRADDAEDVAPKIRAAAQYFDQLKKEFPGSNVDIFLVKRVPSLAVYLFDNEAVLTFQPNAKAKRDVPTFRVQKHGALYSYAAKELADLREEGELYSTS